jgi:hypothetical protein
MERGIINFVNTFISDVSERKNTAVQQAEEQFEAEIRKLDGNVTDDDIFVYNFHGNSGRFRVRKNGTRGYQVQYLTPTNLVIEIVMNNNASSSNQVNLFDEVDYFTIFDENGNKYIFDIIFKYV